MKIQTNMHKLIFLAACVLFTTTECITTYQHCPAEVVQGTIGVVTCVGYTASPIAWELKSGQSAFSTVGECTSSAVCTLRSTYDNVFTLAAISGSSSQLNLTTRFTATLKDITLACDGEKCNISIVAPPTTVMTTTEAPKEEGLTGGQIAGIVIGCVIAIGVIIGVVYVIIWSKKEKKLCFGTTGNGRGNMSLNASASDKPADPNATGPAVPDDGRTRALPQPKGRQGATVAPNETPGVVDNASSSPRTRQLPQPRITEHNMTTSLPPASLPPLRTQAATSLTSVERNSYAETKKPLPSISPRETQ